MGVGTIVAGILIAFLIIVIVGIAIMAGISHSIDVQEKEKAAWKQSKLKARQAEADAEVYCIQKYSHEYCGGLSLEEKINDKNKDYNAEVACIEKHDYLYCGGLSLEEKLAAYNKK